MNKSFVCTGCNASVSRKSGRPVMLACSHCGRIVLNETGLILPERPHPDDWSIIQTGTTGTYKTRIFEVVGRVRIQMQREYKNYWCLWYPVANEYGWLIESLGFYALCPGGLFELKEKDDLKQLKAGKKLAISGQSTLALDNQDHCEGLSYSGELNEWTFYAPHFNIVHGDNGRVVASFFHISPSEHLAKFFVGEWVTWESLNLKNVRIENGW